MEPRRIIRSESKYEEMFGYSRAVVDNEWVFISGTAGNVDADGSPIEDVADQTRRAVSIITETLQEADAALSDVVQLRVFVAERADVLPAATVLGEVFADTRPTNTTVLCGFAAPEIKVEIEAVALRRR